MIELLENLQFWQWWLFAGTLVVVETLLPSGILYGVAFAAFSVGAALAAPNIDFASAWQVQLEGFAGLSIVFGWIGWKLRNRMLASRAPDLAIDGRPTQPLKPPRESEPPLNLKQAAPPAQKTTATPAKPAAPKPAAVKPKPKPKPAAAKPGAPKPATKPAAKPTPPKPAAKQAPPKPVAKPMPPSPPEPDFIGGIYTIWSPISGGTGSIKIKGTDYALVGPDLPAGTRIKVTDVKNKILKIEAVDK